MSAPEEPLGPGSTPPDEDRRRRTRAGCTEENPAEDGSAGSGGGGGGGGGGNSSSSCDRCSSSCPRCLQRAGPGGAPPPDSAGPRCCCCCCCPLSLSRLRGSAAGWASPLLHRRGGGEAPGPAGGDTERRRRREADTGRDMFLWPSQIYKPTELQCGGGVLSDSENEEPVGKKTRMVSAFIRRNAKSAKDASQRTVQRSQSCTDSVEGKGKVRLVSHPSSLDKMCVSHSDTAGILLSSENSLGRRSLSAPVAADRRPVGWRSLMTSQPSSCPASSSSQQPRALGWCATLQPQQQQRERSASPESSSDSISEELNHFKPIVSSPCTPPKRLPDGRLLQPSIVKSTPRNLTRGLQSANSATSYEVGPVLLQKWRQIELDRNRNRDPSFVVASKATLTSPVIAVDREASEDAGAEQGGCVTGDEVKGHLRVGLGDRDAVFTIRRRALFQQTEETDTDGDRQKPLVRVFVPARRLDPHHHHQTGTGTAVPSSRTETPLCKKRTFSPSSDKNSRTVAQQQRSGKTEGGGSSGRSSGRGRKRSRKSRHLEEGAAPPPGAEQVRRGSQEIVEDEEEEEEEEEEEHCEEKERCLRDGALALRLQRHFDNLERDRRRDPIPDKYFLRSWSTSNQSRRRSRRIAKQHS